MPPLVVCACCGVWVRYTVWCLCVLTEGARDWSWARRGVGLIPTTHTLFILTAGSL